MPDDDPGAVSHPCPIRAVDSEEPSPLPVDRRWCFDAWAERVAALPASWPERRWPPEDWTLWSNDRITISYTAMDWVNPAAEIALIGISPGRHQGWLAAKEAGIALRDGARPDDALRRADRTASFSGPMRANLVAMLDGIGIADALDLGTSAALFADAHHRASLLSATGFPVFVDGRNYTGSAPPLDRSPVLTSLVRCMLGGDLALTPPTALLVPLGTAAQQAVRLFIADGTVDKSRCLIGIPHPSGANGHRVRLYKEHNPRLRARVTAWAASRSDRSAIT